MLILFCNNILNQKKVDPDYAYEYEVAKKKGLPIQLISYESIIEGNIQDAISTIKLQSKKTKAIYRGWMLSVINYKALYNALSELNIQLINTPKQYTHCHYLPESYSKIVNHTPLSYWVKCESEVADTTLIKLLSNFNEESIIVKDFVKSEKHNWKEACFIPNASDTKNALAIIRNFLKRRGNQLNEGVVIRKFEQLEFLKNHSKSGMPLTKEYRLFFMNNKKIAMFAYWDEGFYKDEDIDCSIFETIATTVQSNFFSMDIAKKENGDWIIMELGDAQVAGLPEESNADLFYTEIVRLK